MPTSLRSAKKAGLAMSGVSATPRLCGHLTILSKREKASLNRHKKFGIKILVDQFFFSEIVEQKLNF